MLRLRKSKLLPQQVSDLGAFIFVTMMIPVTYIWEVAVVSQSLFPKDSVTWYIHMLFGLAGRHKYAAYHDTQRTTRPRKMALLCCVRGGVSPQSLALLCVRGVHS